jgi:hypothetical protein
MTTPSFDDQSRQQQAERRAAQEKVASTEAITDQWSEHRTVLSRDLVQVLAQWSKMLRKARIPFRFSRLNIEKGRTRRRRFLLLWHPKAWYVRGQIFILWWQNYWLWVATIIMVLLTVVLFSYLAYQFYLYLPEFIAEIQSLLPQFE